MAFRLLKPRLSPFLRHSILNPPKPLNPLPPPFLRRHLPSPQTPSRRHFSSPRYASRPPVDIVTRARQLQNRRLWQYGLTVSCSAGFIVIVLANFQDQLIFYMSPTEAMKRFSANPSKARFRLGGLVLEGSVIEPSPSSPEMEFVMTDLLTDILVRYEGSLPDLFREGHSIVVEGFLRPSEEVLGVLEGYSGPQVATKARSLDCYFRAAEVLAKHDEKYMPKEVAAAIEKNKKILKERGVGVLALEKSS